jgi:hypothetical protein
MICYHTTTKEKAEAIQRDGFRDATGSYGFANIELTGVWLADTPLGINDGIVGDHVLRVEFPDDVDLPEPIVDPEHDFYRERIVPADLINTRATVTLLTDEELERMGVPIWRDMDDVPEWARDADESDET